MANLEVAVFGQVATGLPHDPDRWAIQRAAGTRREKTFTRSHSGIHRPGTRKAPRVIGEAGNGVAVGSPEFKYYPMGRRSVSPSRHFFAPGMSRWTVASGGASWPVDGFGASGPTGIRRGAAASSAAAGPARLAAAAGGATAAVDDTG